MSNYNLPDEVYYRIDNAKPVTSGMYDPYIDEGNSEFEVVSIEPYNDNTHGPSVRATFFVVSSDKAPAGQRRAQTWNLVKPPKFPNGETDADRFADFVRKLKGAPLSHPIGQDIRTLIKYGHQGGRCEHQLARGMRIKAFGKNKGKQKPFIVPTWFTVEQTPQDIAQRRAALDAAGVQAVPQGGGAPAAQQYQQPAPQGYAPAPQTQQYQQPAPQGAAPGFAVAPQAAPAPQGGFLSQLPPPGTGTPQGGGNGGGFSW